MHQTDQTPADVVARRVQLAERLAKGDTGVGCMPGDPFVAMRQLLLRCANTGRLKESAHQIHSRLQKRVPKGSPTEVFLGTPQDEKAPPRDFKRTGKNLHLTRHDGAWFDFALRLEPAGDRQCAVIEYHFEIRFTPVGSVTSQQRSPAWLRFDLNPPDQANADNGLRAHVHPGHEELLLPAPVFNPLELIDLFVFGLVARDPDKPRAA